MRVRRLLVPGPEGKPVWVRPYVQAVGEQWAAMIVADDVSPPAPGHLKGIIFFGDTPDQAERLAITYLGEGMAQN